MPMRSFRLLAFLLAVGPAGTAGASPLNWSGTLNVVAGEFRLLDGARGGGVATVNGVGHLGSLRLAASRGGISGSSTRFLTDPDTVGNSIAAVQLDAIELGTGSFFPVSGSAASTSALVANTLPVHGVVRLCLVTTACDGFLELILNVFTRNGATLGVGVGGVITIGGGGPLRISIVAAPWTLATVTVIDQITTTGGAEALAGVTFAGFVHDPVSGTTSTAQPGGAVQLVTPAQVETTVRLGSVRKIASGLVLRIRFLPEPGLLLLLGSGVAGLALLGVARRQRG